MLDNPAEFVNLSIDVCDQQKSTTMKCGAMRILENLCDTIDGSLTYISYIACHLQTYAQIKASPEELKTPEFQIQSELGNTKFFQTTDHEQKADVSLMILINISYHMTCMFY